jgi:hypothetical protein
VWRVASAVAGSPLPKRDMPRGIARTQCSLCYGTLAFLSYKYRFISRRCERWRAGGFEVLAPDGARVARCHMARYITPYGIRRDHGEHG